jgi:ankyrin repeat protein
LDIFFAGDCDIVEVELLLAKGAYVDPLASNVTPLYLAAREGNDAATKILLDHNADVS